MSAKKQKIEKKIPAKKLPGLLKKSYTKQAFEKKLISKLYVEDDKKLLTSLFSEKARQKDKDVIFIPKDKEFTKKEFKQLKALAKDIKKNKGRIKLVPFIAVASFVAALVIVVCLFKNPVLKYLVESGCEAIFGAKCEVGSCNIELTGIDITINNIAIGDKSSEGGMKNLFVADRIALSVNLTNAIRGKFDCDEISITGMDYGTARTTSCLLPPKETPVNKDAEESEFMKSVKSRSANAVADVKSQIETMLGGSTPDEIWQNLQSQLKTQAAADELKVATTEKIAKWKSKPEELKKQVSDLQASVKDVQSINVSSLKDVTQIKSTLDKVQSALKQIDSTKKSIASVKTDLDKDTKEINAAKKNLTDAINSDMKLAEGVVDTAKNAPAIMNNLMDTAGYDMLGEYYPYAKMGIDYAVQWKKNAQAASKDDKDKVKVKESSKSKGSTNRLKGTDFWFGTDVPALYIKKIQAASRPESDFKLKKAIVENVSSNQDWIGKPTTASLDLSTWGITHKGDITVDARTKTSAPLVKATYEGNGFNANYNAKQDMIPSISGKTRVSFTGSFNDINDLSGSGEVEVNKDGDKPVLSIEKGFGNETFDKALKSALESQNRLFVKYGIKFSESSGVDLSLSGNYSDILNNAVKGIAQGIGSDVQAQLKEKIKEKTDGYSSDALAKVNEFTGISTDLNTSSASLDDIEKQLKAKEKELISKTTGAATDKAKSAASSAASSALKKLF